VNMETLTEPTMWSKDSPAWGSGRRQQRNAYAYKVTMRMTRGELICPACLNPLDLDTAEVDRTIPALDYCPGNIVYLCHGCNNGRGILQSVGRDWLNVEAYVRDVKTASVGIAIPTVSEARQWWARRPTVVTRPRYNEQTA
jgi:hypothetical protein